MRQIADAAEHEQLRGVEGAAAEDYLAAAPNEALPAITPRPMWHRLAGLVKASAGNVFYPDGPRHQEVLLKNDTPDKHSGCDRQVARAESAGFSVSAGFQQKIAWPAAATEAGSQGD
jgi:hypothetical protein